VLVAFGTCACFGGVNALKNRFPQEETIRTVYKDKLVETMPAAKISDFVTVDYSIPGCPVSKKEVEEVVVGLVTRSLVTLPKYPVCVECKQRLNTCLFDLGEVCLGPVSRAGCNAVCPSGKTVCLGCRGPAEGINYTSFTELVREKGLSAEEMNEKLAFYNGFTEYLNHEG
jgi:coenzyme F420-reducing hydrogenase gamma subunit